MRPFADRLRRASGAEEIWEVVRAVTPVFEASVVSLELHDGGGMGRGSTLVFSSEASLIEDAADTTPTVSFRARFGLVGPKREEGHIELGWRDARAELDRDTEIAVELFCDYVADAYERVRSRPRLTTTERHSGSRTARSLHLPPH